MKNKHAKYTGLHTHDITRKARERVRFCYCCELTGHQAKNCLSSSSTKISNGIRIRQQVNEKCTGLNSK